MPDTPATFERSADEPGGLAARTPRDAAPAREHPRTDPPDDGGLRDILTKVERAKQEWEATADALPQLISLLDEHGAVLRTNRVLESWALGSVRSVAGLDFHRLLHPHCAASACYLRNLLEETASVIRNGRRSDLETYDWVLKRDVHVTLVPIVDRAQRLQDRLVVIIEDISERKQAELALRRYTARAASIDANEAAILAGRKAPERVVAWL